MTDTEMRIAIAEACGWKWFLSDTGIYHMNTELCGPHWVEIPRPENWASSAVFIACPDYPNDLNACHEMEKVLIYTNGCSEQYGCILSQVCLQGAQINETAARFKILHSTARQRCEAFLRCLGLWKESNDVHQTYSY